MPATSIRRLTALAAAAAVLLVVLGGAAGPLRVESPVGSLIVSSLFRLAALSLVGLGTLLLGRLRPHLAGKSLAAAGAAALPVLSAVALLFGPASVGGTAARPGLQAAAAALFVAAWLAAAVMSEGEEPFAAGLSMFRSQWQVPLYAAVASYVVLVLGTYLKAMGGAAACNSWPLCAGPAGVAAAAHMVHRFAVLLAGLLLLYTVAFVWRKHANRPGLLVLAGAAVILYTTEVVLGAQAALGSLTPAGAVGHLVAAAALIGTLVALSAAGYHAPSLPMIAGASQAVALPALRPPGEVARDYLTLTKPRILILLLITGYAAMWVAAGGFPNVALSAVAMLGLAMSCGAANAINMWFDRDIDAVMNRTRKRPLPTGRLTPAQALGFGVLMGALSFVLLAAAVNLTTALLSLGGLLFYVLIYTMWLKRSSTQNIVIGGAAGAVPPMVGWAAVTGRVDWAAVVMFLIVFMWTPPHFWALALFRNEDYKRANVPMLPVVRGERHTKWQILIYSALMIPTTAALYWTGVVGQVYLWVSTALGATMVVFALLLMRERLPSQKWAVRTFIWSIFWLYLVFLVMVVDVKPLG